MKTINKITDIKELATEIVGDGKSPNKWFVTIGYGWYKPNDNEEMVQIDGSLDSVTAMFTSRSDAEQFFDAIPIYASCINEVTRETIGQIIMEDRKTGTIKEKCIYQRKNGSFTIERY